MEKAKQYYRADLSANVWWPSELFEESCKSFTATDTTCAGRPALPRAHLGRGQDMLDGGSAYLIEMQSISKAFGPASVLRDVSLRLRPGRSMR